MDTNLALRDATVQDIQLELIRRFKFNAFDGERVVAKLLEHRSLWTAALLDRVGESRRYGPLLLPLLGLIKLRDLPDNLWNADTLYLLTLSQQTARELGQVLETAELGGELIVYDDQSEIDAAVGTSHPEFGLVTVWWD